MRYYGQRGIDWRIDSTCSTRRTCYSRCPNPSTQTRLFSTSPCLHKKGNKAAKAAAQSEEAPTKSTPADDPTDFTALEAEITSAIERLKIDLSKLRVGGRFNPEVLENLRVQPDKNSNETVRLNDLAQIIPKGRTVQILVSEKEYVKAVTTAIVTSRTLNPALTPQPDPTGTNPLLLVVHVPPPTAESRKAAVNEAAKAGEKATVAVRDARAKQQKKLRAAEKDKSVRPDDLKKASTAMEKVVEKGQGEVKRVVDAAKKVLENG